MTSKKDISIITNILDKISGIIEKAQDNPNNISSLDLDLINKKIIELYDHTTNLSLSLKKSKDTETEILQKTEEEIESSVVEKKPAEKKIVEEKIEKEVVEIETQPEETAKPELPEPKEEKETQADKIAKDELPEPKEEKEEKLVGDEKTTPLFEPSTETKEKSDKAPKPEIEKEPTEVVEEKVVKEEDKKEISEKKQVNTKFIKKEPSINERIASSKTKLPLADKAHKGSISDIKSAISLNLKLSFIKDLYQGNQKEYKRMIDFLSKCNNYSEAKLFLEGENEKRPYWQEKEELVKTLMGLITRRFR
ncbi:MAG: hypothetical protein U9R42_03280 [Bacteroidota bacterium]|nr:hypothetical protein [Bacteroidota bacterium]